MYITIQVWWFHCDYQSISIIEKGHCFKGHNLYKLISRLFSPIVSRADGSDLSLVISVYEELNLIYKSWKRLNPSVKTLREYLI